MATLDTAAFAALGTGAVVIVADGAHLAAARSAVEAEIDAIDRACSRFRADSDLEAVNRAAGRTVPVGPRLLEAVGVALEAAAMTDGDVDPTIGEALRVLGYDRDFADVAAGVGAAPAVVRVAPVPGWRLVRLDTAAGTVTVPAGVRLDLGATAKALAADRAARAGFEAAGCGVLVSLGGDIATAGEAPSGGWPVRVTDWHAAGVDAPGETVTVTAGGLATSSTTVRRWDRAGEPMHHIVDPASGRPAPVVWRTVSVSAATCVVANVAATAAIVRGEAAVPWLESLRLPARLVRADGTVVRVAGWPEPDADPAPRPAGPATAVDAVRP